MACHNSLLCCMLFLPRRLPLFGKTVLLPHPNQYPVVSPAIMSTYAHLVSARRPSEPEIVDDSEPERIEIRKTLKKQPRTFVENLQSPDIVVHNSFKHVNRIPVIEISGITSYLASMAC